jgi:hypothetical protein
MVGQLALDLAAAMPPREDELLDRVRADQAKATFPRPCICARPLVFAAELGTGACGLCGRAPGR